MSKLKASSAKKARHAVYSKEGRREKNAAAKLARHLKKHPNDTQSANHVKPVTAGKFHQKLTKLEASIKRQMKHAVTFGPMEPAEA